MLRAGRVSLLLFFIAFALLTCIDPYYPVLKGYESMLVVEGLITNENSTYTVNLSRTLQDNSSPPVVSNATVFITDNNDIKTYLRNCNNGNYQTDSLEFRGIIGRTYTLHIITGDGDIYESENCLMQAVPEIDSIYYSRDAEFTNNGAEYNEGIRIYLDSKRSVNDQYYRWSFEETWKYMIPSPKRYNYISQKKIVPIRGVKQYCWKSDFSRDVLIHSSTSGNNYTVVKQPVIFIGTGKSDRLNLEYSILVRQYSISEKEFDFWNNLKTVNESGSDIFASIPYSVISNIHNVNNPKEKVLGYFQVSAVTQKRKFIYYNDIAGLKLPHYRNPCERIEAAPFDDIVGSTVVPMSWDQVYEMYCTNSDFYFIEPMYDENGELVKLVFARPECTNCGSGEITDKPDYWQSRY